MLLVDGYRGEPWSAASSAFPMGSTAQCPPSHTRCRAGCHLGRPASIAPPTCLTLPFSFLQGATWDGQFSYGTLRTQVGCSAEGGGKGWRHWCLPGSVACSAQAHSNPASTLPTPPPPPTHPPLPAPTPTITTATGVHWKDRGVPRAAAAPRLGPVKPLPRRPHLRRCASSPALPCPASHVPLRLGLLHFASPPHLPLGVLPTFQAATTKLRPTSTSPAPASSTSGSRGASQTCCTCTSGRRPLSPCW